MTEHVEALVIGGGPAGLAASEVLGHAGHRVLLVDAMPSVGRKFLMAGKSGLNLTFDAPPSQLVDAYADGADRLRPILQACDAQAVQRWANDLGQEMFTGSTGRAFPKVMKASPLLRAWLARLDGNGVERRTRWRWRDWDGDRYGFDAPDGPRNVSAQAVILALGGASWRRLGSDGAWAPILAARGIAVEPFAASNVGLAFDWSHHMAAHFGTPIKDIAMRASDTTSRGEVVISKTGLEGGGLYQLSAAIRNGAALHIDLAPNRSLDDLVTALGKARAKDSISNILRKSLRLNAAKIALMRECVDVLPRAPTDLAAVVKDLVITTPTFRPLDEAISTAGGVSWRALNDDLMLRNTPGVYCAGEMLDWDAPTGGYLLTACLATGRWAGHAATRQLRGAGQT